MSMNKNGEPVLTNPSPKGRPLFAWMQLCIGQISIEDGVVKDDIAFGKSLHNIR